MKDYAEKMAQRKEHRQQLDMLIKQADAVAATMNEGENTYNELTSPIFRWSRLITWALAKIYNGCFNLIVLFSKPDKSDLSDHSMLFLELSLLGDFITLKDKLALDDEAHELRDKQHELLLKAQTTGGIDAITADAPLLVELMQIKERTIALTDRVHDMYKKKVILGNVRFFPTKYPAKAA